VDAVTAIELLHAAPSTIRVSSQVDNKAISPDHLVDRDLQTAWNSRTGDLVGAWIDVDVGSAKIHELRLTVGHTGKGAKGEDFFTMNPRIRKVTVLRDDQPIATATLDITRRELQPIALPAAASSIRLRIDEIVPGSKPAWREACISELEAWGTLPPGVAATPSKPVVSVGAAMLDPTRAGGPITDDRDYCEHLLVDDRAAYAKQLAQDKEESDACTADPHNCMMGDDYRHRVLEPHCEFTADPRIAKSGPWLAVGLFTRDELCRVAVQTTAGWWLEGEAADCGRDPRDHQRDLTITSAKPHGATIDIRYETYIPGFDTGEKGVTTAFAITCTAAKATVTCSNLEPQP
jgi:hypothetical protein